MQMNLTGFLNAKNARMFISELWDLLLSAMENIGGIPAKFLDQKKEEIKQRQVRSCYFWRSVHGSFPLYLFGLPHLKNRLFL